MTFKFCLLFAVCFPVLSGYSQSSFFTNDQFNTMQLSHGKGGHTIHNTECFSPDDQWIVFDTRNNDTLIGSTGNISMINTHTGVLRELYHTKHQTIYGPGVGAATFSPTANHVIFIHGIQNADKNNPYGFTRRTGVAIDITKCIAKYSIFMYQLKNIQIK